MLEAVSMMGEACYGPINITRRRCVKTVVSAQDLSERLRIGIHSFAHPRLIVFEAVRIPSDVWFGSRKRDLKKSMITGHCLQHVSVNYTSLSIVGFGMSFYPFRGLEVVVCPKGVGVCCGLIRAVSYSGGLQ
jgi:hypothetical protein